MKEKLFGSILTNFVFLVQCGNCLSIIRIPLGIPLTSQNIILELIVTAETCPSITFFHVIVFLFHVPKLFIKTLNSTGNSRKMFSSKDYR